MRKAPRSFVESRMNSGVIASTHLVRLPELRFGELAFVPRGRTSRLDVEHDGAAARWEFTTSDRGRLVYANRLVLPPQKH
jgi:hypothetical protein